MFDFEVVVEAVFDRRSDGERGVLKEVKYCLGENMG